MKPGDLVYVAWISKASGAPEVLERRVVTPGPEVTYLDEALDATRRLRVAPTRMLHATRSAALEALAERLEEEGKRERATAAEHVVKAERCFINAERARRMAEGKP